MKHINILFHLIAVFGIFAFCSCARRSSSPKESVQKSSEDSNAPIQSEPTKPGIPTHTASFITFHETKPGSLILEGTLLVGRASSETDIESYKIYWGKSLTEKLDGYPPVLTLHKPSAKKKQSLYLATMYSDQGEGEGEGEGEGDNESAEGEFGKEDENKDAPTQSHTFNQNLSVSRPNEASHLVVFTSNSHGEMKKGLGTELSLAETEDLSKKEVLEKNGFTLMDIDRLKAYQEAEHCEEFVDKLKKFEQDLFPSESDKVYLSCCKKMTVPFKWMLYFSKTRELNNFFFRKDSDPRSNLVYLGFHRDHDELPRKITCEYIHENTPKGAKQAATSTEPKPLEPESIEPEKEASAEDNKSPPLYAWLQVGVSKPHNENDLPVANHYELRAISDKDSCPSAIVKDARGHRSEKMKVRAAKGESFGVTTCYLKLDSSISTVSVGNFKSASIKKLSELRNAHLVGNTGGRGGWAKSANVFSSLAKDDDLDIVFHLGNYTYDEDNSAINHKWHDDWYAWELEFFSRSNELLNKGKPFVFVRGMRESYHWGTEGYRRFFDPWPFSATEDQTSKAYIFSLNKGHFLVLDTSSLSVERPLFKSGNSKLLSNGKETVSKDLLHFKNWVKQYNTHDNFLLAHDAPWGCAPKYEDCKESDGHLFRELSELAGIETLLEAALNADVHTFSIVSFKDKQSLQITVGNGGGTFGIHNTWKSRNDWTDSRNPEHQNHSQNSGYSKLAWSENDKTWKLAAHWAEIDGTYIHQWPPMHRAPKNCFKLLNKSYVGYDCVPPILKPEGNASSQLAKKTEFRNKTQYTEMIDKASIPSSEACMTFVQSLMELEPDLFTIESQTTPETSGLKGQQLKCCGKYRVSFSSSRYSPPEGLDSLTKRFWKEPIPNFFMRDEGELTRSIGVLENHDKQTRKVRCEIFGYF